MALAVAVRAGQHLDRADGVDPDLGGFPQADAGAERADCRRWRDAAGLDIAAHADAAQLAALAGIGLALRKAGIVCGLHGGVERGLVVAGVVIHDDRRLVGERLDEVLAPQFCRRDAKLARSRLHQCAPSR